MAAVAYQSPDGDEGGGGGGREKAVRKRPNRFVRALKISMLIP